MADEVVVTGHAISRYCERVENIPWDEARAKIAAAATAIEAAAKMGAPVVRLPNGAKLVLEGRKVVTVIEKGQIARDLYPPRAGQ